MFGLVRKPSMILICSQRSVGNIKQDMAMMVTKTVPQAVKFCHVSKSTLKEVARIVNTTTRIDTRIDTTTETAKPIGDTLQTKSYHNMTDKKKDKKKNGMCIF